MSDSLASRSRSRVVAPIFAIPGIDGVTNAYTVPGLEARKAREGREGREAREDRKAPEGPEDRKGPEGPGGQKAQA